VIIPRIFKTYRKTAEERFWAKVDRSDRDGCWPWMGSKVSGYGQFMLRRRTMRAHRLAYSMINHCHVNDAEVVMHTCDNPPCCNPDHLRAGTHADNMRDMVAKGRAKPGIADSRGVKNPRARLSPHHVQAIRADTRPQRFIALEYAISQKHVSRIKRGDSWSHLPPT